jgi:hypothetical protein
MSLFDNIIEVLQEFKNDIISSLKNEIINFKQEIINLNKEKDEEINILKEELLRTRQELEQSQSQQIEYQKEILELQQSFKKLKNQIPSNLPKITEKNNYEELISNCFGLCHLDKFDIRNIQQIDEIYVKVKNIMDDDNEYIIADKSFVDNNYKFDCNSREPVTFIQNEKTDFIITNKGKIFIKYDDSLYGGYNQIYRTGYYYINFNIQFISKQLIHLIISLITPCSTIYGIGRKLDQMQPSLKLIMNYYIDNKN